MRFKRKKGRTISDLNCVTEKENCFQKSRNYNFKLGIVAKEALDILEASSQLCL